MVIPFAYFVGSVARSRSGQRAGPAGGGYAQTYPPFLWTRLPAGHRLARFTRGSTDDIRLAQKTSISRGRAVRGNEKPEKHRVTPMCTRRPERLRLAYRHWHYFPSRTRSRLPASLSQNPVARTVGSAPLPRVCKQAGRIPGCLRGPACFWGYAIERRWS